VAGCALVGLLLICRPYWSGAIYCAGDLGEQFLPWRAFYALALDAGELGIWNPFLCRGYDHHAEGQGGLLHPLHIAAYALLPLTVAAALELVLAGPFAAVGMWIFLRRRGLAPLPAAAGAVLLGFSSFFYAQFTHVNLLWVFAHLGWLLAAVDSCFTGRHRALAAAAVATVGASMVLLGHPQMVWVCGLAALALVVWHQVAAPARQQRASWAALVGGGVIALLIGCAQLLPTADLLARSPRAGLTAAERSNFSLHPANLLANGAPFLFAGSAVGDVVYDAAGDGDHHRSLEFHAYLGLASLLTVYIWLVLYLPTASLAARQLAVWLALAFGITMLLALGRYGGVNALFGGIPVLREFRAPVRYSALAMAVLATAVALVVHRLGPLRGAITRRQRLLLALPFLPVLALAGWAAAASHVTINGDTLALGTPWQALVGPLLAGAVLVLMLLAGRGRNWAAPTLCCLCLIDVTAYGLSVLWHPNSRTRPLADLAHAQQQMAVVDHQFRHASALNAPVWDGHYLASGYLGLPPPQPLDLLNGRHFRLASARVAHGQSRAFTIPDPLPRARLVQTLRQSEDPWADVERIDVRTVALCEDAPLIDGPPLAAGERARIVADGLSSVRIEVRAHATRLLVVSDRWWPGWHATVNGEAQAIIPLFDSTMRGVVVGPGESDVVLYYRSPSLQTGFWCMLAGGLLLLGTVGRGLRDWRAAAPAVEDAASR
jgi:hypothetical protein